MPEFLFHEDPPILEIVMNGPIGYEDLAAGLARYADARFTKGHHVLLVATDASVDFSLTDLHSLRAAFGGRDRRGKGTRTAFVVSDSFVRGIGRVARGMQKDWPTHWKFFHTRDEAVAWISDAEPVGSDFSPDG